MILKDVLSRFFNLLVETENNNNKKKVNMQGFSAADPFSRSFTSFNKSFSWTQEAGE